MRIVMNLQLEEQVARQRLKEARAEAARWALVRSLRPARRPARVVLGHALIKAGLREGVKVMIGGAPVSQAFADEIGADGYAKDSTLAVVKAKALLGVGAGVA